MLRMVRMEGWDDMMGARDDKNGCSG